MSLLAFSSPSSLWFISPISEMHHKHKREKQSMNRHLRVSFVYIIVFILLIELFCPLALHAGSVDNNTDQFHLGWQAYDDGRFEEAFGIWQTLAQNGDVRAQINLGTMYDSGRGVNEDPVLAARWYLEAAQQGNYGAQYNLAVMYATGRGVPHDVSASAEWYKKAAQQNFSIAQYDLGMLYATGAGVLQDTELAIQWFYKAGLSYLKENDNEGALTALDAINKLVPGHDLAASLKERLCPSKLDTNVKLSPDIFQGASTGTAWPIVSGYVVTCNHIVSDVDRVTLLTASGSEIGASIILRDEENDIALLQADEIDKLPDALPLAESQARLGAEVFTIGFPRLDVMGKTPKLSVGIISSVNGLYDDPASYQTTVPIQPGNSGGPVLNMKGEVVGVASSMLGVRDAASGNISMLANASCVTKIDTVHNLLRLLPHKDNIIKVLPRKRQDLENLAARTQSSVLIVIAR
jgi:S1-C subfamily serine protease